MACFGSYHYRPAEWSEKFSHSSIHSRLIRRRRPIRKDRTGFTPGTLPLITFDRCAFETRRYKAACESVMTEVVEFGRIISSLEYRVAMGGALFLSLATDADEVMDCAGSNGDRKVLSEEARDLAVSSAFPPQGADHVCVAFEL